MVEIPERLAQSMGAGDGVLWAGGGIGALADRPGWTSILRAATEHADQALRDALTQRIEDGALATALDVLAHAHPSALSDALADDADATLVEGASRLGELPWAFGLATAHANVVRRALAHDDAQPDLLRADAAGHRDLADGSAFVLRVPPAVDASGADDLIEMALRGHTVVLLGFDADDPQLSAIARRMAASPGSQGRFAIVAGLDAVAQRQLQDTAGLTVIDPGEASLVEVIAALAEAIDAASADDAATDHTARTELTRLVDGLPRRAEVAHNAALGASGLAVAERVEALGVDGLADTDTDTLLRAGAVLLARGRGELAARCFSALEGREQAAGLARHGLAWTSWIEGQAEACADGLRAAAELDPTVALLPAGSRLTGVRARAGALVVLAATDDEGEHDIERVTLARPLIDAERRGLQETAQRLTGLSSAAVAGYRGLALEGRGARLRRDPVPGKTLASTLDAEPRPLSDALAIIAPLAEGLASAHDAGLVHGGIVAELVTVAPGGAVLRGVGLASLIAPSSRDAATGAVAPERLAGAGPTAKSDAYALAALLYRLVTGRHPTGAVVRPSALSLDARLDELFAQGLHPDAVSRLDVSALATQAEQIASTPGAAVDVASAPSQPISVPDDPDNLDAWAAILDRKSTHREARDAIVRIEAEGRRAERWDRVAEVLGLRAKYAEVQQRRVELRRELIELYEKKLGAPASAFREVQNLIEEIPANEQITAVAELRRLAEVTGQWGPLADSLEIVAGRVPDVSDQARLYTGLGRVFAERLGAADRAVAAYEKAIEIEANASNLSAVAPLYRKAGQFPELAGTLLNLADHQEGEAKAQSLRDAATVLHDELEDAEGAFATLRAALEEEPGHAEALAQAEGFARELEDWESLVDLLEKRAATSLDDGSIRELRTEAAQIAATQLDNPALAIELLDKILAREPEHEPTVVHRVELLRPLAGDDADRRDALIDALDRLAALASRPEQGALLWAEQASLLDSEPEGKARAAAARERVVQALGPEHETAQQATEALERWYRREEQHDALVTLLRGVGASDDLTTPARIEAWSKVWDLRKEGGPVPDEDGTIEALEALSALDGEDHRWRDALLERYLAHEQFDKAGPLIRAQVYDDDIDPKRKAALLWRGGKLREQLGKAEGALEALEEAVALDPDLHDAWIALRDLYRQREQPLKAIEAQVSAARAHPSRAERAALTFEAATTYLDTLGQPDTGLALLEELVEFDPDHREANGKLVERLVNDGDLARAWPFSQTWVSQVRAQAADDKALNLRALSIAGRCALAVEQPDRAREYLEKARSFDATNLDVLRLLGELDLDAERWQDALRSYQSVVLGAADEMAPTELSQVYLRMADARLGMKERAKAIQLIERALDIDADQRPAIDKLVDLAENPDERVKARLRLAELLARREAKREGEERAAVQTERVELLLEIATAQAKELDAPEDAARTLESILDLEPDDPAVLHRLLETFTQAGRWRDATRVLDSLATVQDSDGMRAKYLYAGAAIFRDQLDDADSYGEWALRVLAADPSHSKAERGYTDMLERKGAWKDLAKYLRGRLKSLPKDAPIDDRVGLFVRLGNVYEEHLGDPKTALAAYSQAVRFAPTSTPEVRQRRVKIMSLALSLGDDEIDKAVTQGHALIASDPMDFDVYHRLVELYQKREDQDRATALSRTLAFLKQATEQEQALADAAAQTEAQIRSVVSREHWRKALYHPQQDARLTEIFAIVWPMVAAREGHSHAHHSIARDERAKLSLKSSDHLARYLAYAAQIFDVPVPDYFPRPKEPGGLRIDALCEGEGDQQRVFPTVIAGRDTLRDESEAGLKFRAAGAVARVRPGHLLASVLPSAASLRHVFYGAASLSGIEVPPDSAEESQRLAKHLKRFITPAQSDQLGALAKKVLEKGDPDLKGWVQGIAFTSGRAGFVLCDSIDSAARVLTQQGDEGMAVPFKERIRDLVAYSVSPNYLKLRKVLGLTR